MKRGLEESHGLVSGLPICGASFREEMESVVGGWVSSRASATHGYEAKRRRVLPMDEVCDRLLRLKRGLAFVYLHYIYKPLRFKRKQDAVHTFLSRQRSSLTTLELEESVANAKGRPFHASFPDGRGFFNSADFGQPALDVEAKSRLPGKRVLLREVLSEWQQALTVTPHFNCCRKTRRRYFSRAPIWVRRSSVFDDAAEGILAAKRIQLLSGVHVRFIGPDGDLEAGVDSGGLSREFFDLVLKEITTQAVDPSRYHRGASNGAVSDADDGPSVTRESSILGFGEPMFCQQDDGTLMVQPSSRPLAVYFALGRLLATALVHASHGDVALPLVFDDCLLKYVVGQPITAVDVRRRDPLYYENRINALLKPGGIQLMADILCVDKLTFEEQGVELKPGGSSIQVEEHNVEEYVKLLSEYYLCGEVRKQLSLFIAGFHDVIPQEILQRCGICFADLGMILSGVPNLDVREWRANAVVRPAGVEEAVATRVSNWLWEVLDMWADEDRALVLAFASGCSRLPVVGFNGLDPVFTVEVVPLGKTSVLPTSHTCMNSLTIPAYEHSRELASKLAFAVREGAGSFDLR